MAVDALVRQYVMSGHPLGWNIEYEEVPGLVQSLRERLDTSEQVLDLSSASLKRLERLLDKYHQRLVTDAEKIADEDVVQLVREIGTYFGQVLVVQLGATWKPGMNDLLGNEVEIAGPIKVVEGRHSWSSPRMVFALHNIGSSTWACIIGGKSRPRLYTSYLAAKRKISKH